MEPAFTALNELSPQFQGFFGQLQDVVDASEKGLPAFNRILKNLPPLLDDFQPFLKNANPMVDVHRRRTSARSRASSPTRPRRRRRYDLGGQTAGDQTHRRRPLRAHVADPQPRDADVLPAPARHVAAQPLRGAGQLLDQLKNGASIFGRPCPSGNVALPTDASTRRRSLPLIQPFVVPDHRQERGRRAGLQDAGQLPRLLHGVPAAYAPSPDQRSRPLDSGPPVWCNPDRETGPVSGPAQDLSSSISSLEHRPHIGAWGATRPDHRGGLTGEPAHPRGQASRRAFNGAAGRRAERARRSRARRA